MSETTPAPSSPAESLRDVVLGYASLPEHRRSTLSREQVEQALADRSCVSCTELRGLLGGLKDGDALHRVSPAVFAALWSEVAEAEPHTALQALSCAAPPELAAALSAEQAHAAWRRTTPRHARQALTRSGQR
jgi:hypothetical protein